MAPARPPRFADETETMVRDSALPRPLGAVVRVVDAPCKPAQLPLARGRCVVGTAPDSDLVVAHPTVSRRHAELELVPGGVEVRDLGSHNGIFYLGQRVERMTLALGGRLQLGAVTLAVDLDTAQLDRELPLYPHDHYRGLVGPSVAMRRLFAVLSRVEGSLVTVLVEGESGVGKELIAHAVHDGSSVREGPLVTVDCGAVPAQLLASELFGHRRGAFTGAVEPRQGAMVSAHGGTLFLDEIGELPLDVQPLLLRALETGEVSPVGSDERRRVNVRVVAATNRRLEEEVRAGRFREDLFYRLAVVRLSVPPLRERPEDIDALAHHLAARRNITLGPEVLAQLRSRPWPGNVRELRNVVDAYSALGILPEGPTRTDAQLVDLLRRRIDLDRPYGEQKDALIDCFTQIYLEALLARTDGNQTQAAELAGLGRTYLGRLLQKYGLKG